MKYLFLLLNSGFSCSLFKNPILREKFVVKLKIALLRKAAVLGRQRINAPKNQLLFADQGQEFLNGNFRSAQVEVFSGRNPLQYSCLESPMNSMKRQKDRTLKDELPRSVGAQNATGNQWRNNSGKNEEMEPKQKQQTVMDVTSDGSKV